MNDERSFHLDSRQVRASFDRASASYERAATLQHQVADELLNRLETFPLQPKVVLDLGSGPGRSTALLKQRFRRATVVALDLAPGMLDEARRHQKLFRRFERLCADATRLPLRDSTVDIIFSSLMLQWCDLDAAFAEARRVLKPDGLLLFSTFGPDTLKELRAAWGVADASDPQAAFLPVHVNQFYDMHDVGDAVVRAGLSEPVLDIDRIELRYPDPRELMHELKAIGAHNVTAGRARGLTGKSRFRRMQAAYEAFRRDGGLPATYEIVYGTAWGGQGRGATRSMDGQFRIAPGSIKRRGST